MIWIGGRWMRDQKGWYRVAGYWSPRRGGREPAPLFSSEDQPAWKTTGPPADHPRDTTAPAPGPDYFFVAGHYEPVADGSRLAWKPGFWTREQPGLGLGSGSLGPATEWLGISRGPLGARTRGKRDDRRPPNGAAGRVRDRAWRRCAIRRFARGRSATAATLCRS